MKKAIVLVLVFAVAMCAGLFILPDASANAQELTYDEFDQVFIATINDLGKENYVGDLNVSASKELLYDLHLGTLGYVYDFTVNGESGYAIVINANGNIEVVELCFDAQNPYASIGATLSRVYVNLFTYLTYGTDGFRSTDGEILPGIVIDEFEGKAYYYISGTLTPTTSTISYVSKSESSSHLALTHPGITASVATYPSCGPIAAANIVQYWDRYYGNIIEDYTPGTLVGSSYVYDNGQTLGGLVDQLYSDMYSPTDSAIDTTKFRVGLQKYCMRKGMVPQYTECSDYASVKSAFAQGYPVAIFLDTFSFATISAGDTQATLTQYGAQASHIMAGFGYREITYTFTNGTRTDRYIAVATGRNECPRAYLNYDQGNQIDIIYSVGF